MATIITRLYASRDKADEVVKHLAEEEFTSSEVGMIAAESSTSEEGGATQSADVVISQIMESGVHSAAAKRYAERVLSGNALVVVSAPFGTANRATTIVDSFQPIDTGDKFDEVYSVEAPPSNIYRGRPPVALLKSDQKLMTGDKWPGVTDSGVPFSSAIGLQTVMEAKQRDSVLRDWPTPFSSILRLAVLTKRRPRLSVLRENATPFSSALRLPLLTGKDKA